MLSKCSNTKVELTAFKAADLVELRFGGVALWRSCDVMKLQFGEGHCHRTEQIGSIESISNLRRVQDDSSNQFHLIEFQFTSFSSPNLQVALLAVGSLLF